MGLKSASSSQWRLSLMASYPFLMSCFTMKWMVVSLQVSKATHTNRYCDFLSHHPVSHKKAVISTLLTRSSTHSSTSESLETEKYQVFRALECNGYPVPFMNQQASCLSRRPSHCRDEEWLCSAVIPYVKGVSEATCCVLSGLNMHVCF